MNIKIKIVALCMLVSTFVLAQSYSDAFLFSNNQQLGTARSAGMSNAFGALGADMSGIYINPAGLGVYQSVDFSFSLGINGTDVTNYYGSNKTVTSSDANLNLTSLGLVFPIAIEANSSDWRRTNLGLTYNTTNIFNSSSIVQGYGEGSLVDPFYNFAYGNSLASLNSFYEYGAFQTDLIDLEVDENTGEWIDNGEYFREVSSGQDQYKVTDISGKMNEFNISYAGSYKEKLYLGASLGILGVEYVKSSYYVEDNFDDNNTTVQSFNYAENQYTSGSGINFKVGAILKATNSLRLGLAWHSPSLLNLKDEYETSLNVFHSLADSAYSYSYLSPYGIYEYTVKTPMKVVASAALVLNKSIVLSADIEVVDYTEMELKGDIEDSQIFTTQNDLIQSKYTQVFNTRLAAEVNLSPILLRAGYSNSGSPIAEYEMSDPTAEIYTDVLESYSFGIGKRSEFRYLDLAFVFSEQSKTDWLYNSNFATPIKSIESRFDIVFTMGWKFN